MGIADELTSSRAGRIDDFLQKGNSKLPCHACQVVRILDNGRRFMSQHNARHVHQNVRTENTDEGSESSKLIENSNGN